jgi:hypothetical protein
MLCRKQLHRILLIAVLGLSLGACVPYSDGGGSYYRSDVYTSPAPAAVGATITVAMADATITADEATITVAAITMAGVAVVNLIN